jgi:phenylacetate-CoA ligase
MNNPNRSFFNESDETISVTDLKKLQLQKLKNVLNHVNQSSKFYQQKYKGINTDINSFSEFTDIPLTNKKELLELSPYDNLCVDVSELSEVHFSSGTTAHPIPSFMTCGDLEKSRKFLSRTWYMQGVRDNSVFCMLAYYGLFSAGLLNHYAIQNIGAFVIPAGSSGTEKTISLLKEYNVDITAAVASYYLYIIDKAKTLNLDLKDLNLKKVVLGGEPFSEAQRKYIEDELNVEVYDQYGLCEINTGLAGECEHHNGLHILADYAYPEIIDPETLEVLPEGEVGELVLTTLEREASPLIRYRTGDLTSLTYERCACGRTMPRISRIAKRGSSKIFYKGIKIEKDAFEDYILTLKDIINPLIWQLLLKGEVTNQSIELLVNLNKSSFNDIKELNKVISKFLNVKTVVRSFNEDELKNLESKKLNHFVDTRNI